MSDWQEVTLGEVADVLGGGTPSTQRAAYWGGDIPWLTPGELTKQEGKVITTTQRTITAEGLANSSAKMLPKGAVLLTSRATVGAVALAGCPMATNQGFQSLVPRSGLVPEFLMCWIQDNRDEFERRASGSTFPEISGKKVKTIALTIPPLNEQRRIVAVMAAVRAQVEALEAEHRAVQTLYADGLGLLWLDESGSEARSQPLSNHMALDLTRVRVESTSEYAIAGVLNAGQGLIIRETIRGSATDYATLNRLSAGRAIMRKLTAWEGTLAVVPAEFDGFYASNEFPTFRFRQTMSASYFTHVCRSPRLWAEMRNRVTGTVQRRKRLNPDQLLAVLLPIPDLATQERATAVLDEISGLADALVAEIAALRIVRADLLTALLSHEISVDEAVDRFVETAA